MATRYNYTGGIVTDGLVLHLDAAKRDSYPGSGTTVYDLSKSGVNGTLMNGAAFSGVSKNASIQLDGTNDYIDLGTQSLIENDFCISIWVEADVIKEHFYFSTGYSSAGSMLIFSDGIWINSSSEDGRIPGAPGTNIGSAMNITVTRTGSDAKWYKNGVEQYSLTYSGSIGTGTTYTIGYAIPRNKSTAYHEGDFYQIQIYDRGLTASEITQNYNALKGRYGL